jgi:hypothetical protein
MALTKAEATARLAEISSAEQLRDLIKEIDTKGTGTTTLLWSGTIGFHGANRSEFISSHDIAKSIGKADSSIRTIGATEAGRFLNLDRSSPDFNQDLDNKLKELFEGRQDQINDFLYGAQSGTTQRRTSKGVWDDVSHNFTSQASGNVRTLVGGARADKVFAQTELPQLLRNPAVRSIDEIPIWFLHQLEASGGISDVFDLLTGLSEATVGQIPIEVDDTGRPIQNADGIYQIKPEDFLHNKPPDLSLAPLGHGLRTISDFIPGERQIKHAINLEQILEKYPDLYQEPATSHFDDDPYKRYHALSRLGNYAGSVADVLGMMGMLHESAGHLQRGNFSKARETFTSWSAESVGGLVAGRIAGALVAPLMATGPLGMLFGAGVILGASIAGGEFLRRLIGGGESLKTAIAGEALLKKLIQKLDSGVDDLNDMLSPLILDLDGNGVQTLPLRGSGIYFDHDSNGIAEKTGWVSPSDGLLVIDLNQNGVIDHGRELFGNHSRLSDDELAEHGFAALAKYDSNRDRKIDAKDLAWSRLKIWQDLNSNAKTDPGELFTLEGAGVKVLFLNFRQSPEIDVNGNDHRLKGTYQKTSGQIAALTDVWFAVDTQDSRFPVTYQVDSRTAALPNLPSIGIVPSLHQAMMAPNGSMVRNSLTRWLEGTRLQRMALRHDLLFQWCDASNNPFGFSDRLFVHQDPMIKQKVAVIEKLMGQMLHDSEDGMGSERSKAAIKLSGEIALYIDMMLSEQVHIKPLFDLAVPLETLQAESLGFDVTDSLAYLRSQFQKDPDPGLIPMVQWLLMHQGQPGVQMFDALRQLAMISQDAFGLAMRRQLPATKPWEWMAGTTNGETLSGSKLDEFIEAGAGVDHLHGREGNDTLHGGPGADFLYGGSGADTYIISQNLRTEIETIRDEAGVNGQIDQVIFWDVRSHDVRLNRSGDHVQFFSGSQQIALIERQLNPLHRIEEFHFADGVTWDHATLLRHLPVQGTAGNDRLTGTDTVTNRFQGLAGHDTLIGGALADHLEGQHGNDVLIGHRGSDTLDGGAGNDLLDGGEGGDCYLFGHAGGHDRIAELDAQTSELDRVIFSGLRSTNLTRVQGIGSDLKLHFGSTTSLTLVNQLQPLSSIESFHFADGVTWDQAALLRQIS